MSVIGRRRDRVAGALDSPAMTKKLLLLVVVAVLATFAARKVRA
jgi:hypothetical protein